MEYTDAPTSQPAATQPGWFPCPLCGQMLAEGAKQCFNCDWTRSEGEGESAEGKASDLVAVLLSVIPGLGHVYKGHQWMGFLFLLGAPFAVGLSLLAATATAGFGLGLMVIYWFAVMFHVYGIEDRVAPTSAEDEGEQY